jgi:pimeloyl-ACP methyl ester carboxylesterase
MASIVFPKNSKSVVVSDGTRYGYVNIPAQPNKPTLLFVHGYPSSSYHWHKQVSQCQDSGYGMIAPDLLGYGDTDKPSNVEAYDNTIIARQLIDVLDYEKVDTVIGVGHDWGSTVLSTTARLYTNRFERLIFLTRAYVSSQVCVFHH